MTIGEGVFVTVPNWIDQLPLDARTALQMAMQSRAFPRGALIYNRAEKPGGLYLIRSGSALFQIDGANGNRLLLKIVRENELFGEIVAYDGKPAPIAVEARSLLSTDFIPAPQLEQLRGVHPEIDKALATVATQNLRAALAAIDELCLMDLYERAVSCLRRLCTEATESGESATRLDITQTEFASMLGASRQATNKILGQLEREKLLKRNFRNLECNLLFSQRLMHARAE
jgi:CRP/FNR family transcriptional regulator, cyclic AMP receptor protein